MTNLLTTRMSSRGQVVIPEELRKEFGWKSGTSFSVLVYRGSVIMQPLQMPSEAELAAYAPAIQTLRGSLGGVDVTRIQSGKTRAEISAMEKNAWRKSTVRHHVKVS